MTMFGSPIKRSNSESPSKPAKAAKMAKSHHHDHKHHNHSHNASNDSNHQSEPRFSFDEVKEMIDRLLAQPMKTSAACTAGMRSVNFEEIAVPGHSVAGCKDLIERMISRTRRIRTLQEVLTDIKDNLNKRTYTEIIHRATLDDEAPKRPPSAYLLYHQDRYNDLKHESPKAAVVSKIVSEEWKTLSDKKRREYQKKHDELVKKYEAKMKKLGLIDKTAPKRPKTARSLYITDRMGQLDLGDCDKERLAQLKEELGQEFENLDSSEKAEWNRLHRIKKAEYQREREEYIAAHPHLNHTQPERAKTVKERITPPNPPKNAFKFFLAKKMPNGLDNEEYDATKKSLKEKFSRLSDKKQLKYIKKAIKDKQRYDAEVKEFKAKYPDHHVANVKQNISKDQWKLYCTKVENKPNLPAPTAYLHYCGRMLSQMHNDGNDGQVPTQRMQNASNSWRSLDPDDKTQVEEGHMEAILSYIDEVEIWLSKLTEERKKEVLAQDPKSHPDYWRKKLNRLKKAASQKKK